MTSWTDDPVKRTLVEDRSTFDTALFRLQAVNGGALGARVYSQLRGF
jgi:hypothetical protein